MRVVVMAAALALAGCAEPSVIELGQNRYRATTEHAFNAAGAERSAVDLARAHCAARGQNADIRMGGSRTASTGSYAVASADFSCVAR